MGTDTPLAVLSDRAQLLFNYFKQLFAQVTNPPIDPIREKVVMNTESLLGCEVNLLVRNAGTRATAAAQGADAHRRRPREDSRAQPPGLKAHTLSTLFAKDAGEAGLAAAVDALCDAAERAVKDGASVLILSDRGVDADRVPVPSLLATAAVHHHLIRSGLRDEVRYRGRNRRGARGPPLRAAHRVRRRGGQPVPRVRDVPGSRRRRNAGRRERRPTRTRDRVQELHEGDQRRLAEGVQQDGHQHADELPRRRRSSRRSG